MTRKIILSVTLILLIFVGYEVIFGELEFVRKYIPSITQLENSNKELETELANLERTSNTDFEAKKNKLQGVIEEYNQTKQKYEGIYATVQSQVDLNEVTFKDMYDIDFLWTIVGNYATEEGINLKFDVKKNNTSLSSMANVSDQYIICDLQFIITGNYINLTDFIYDIEDDDRLNFEINDFTMKKVGSNDVLENAADMATNPEGYVAGTTGSGNPNDLQVTLNVREVKVNLSNLIDSNTVVQDVVGEVSDAVSGAKNTDETAENVDNTSSDEKTETESDDIN